MRRLTRVALVMTSLVILAGSVVRMTGSGMGCPDWPKCFGLLIPPTEETQVTWNSGDHYAPGRMLIAHDTLWVAQSEIIASDFFKEREEGQWLPYTKHDYATFNAVHTWVEFINRLIGALTGFPAIILFILAGMHGWRLGKWNSFVWTMIHLFLLGLVAWMGKKVVDGNLIPFSITLHMLGAMAILMALLMILRENSEPNLTPVTGRMRGWMILSVGILLAQIVLGTQVREVIDTFVHQGLERSDWLSSLPSWWKIHRSGSWAVVISQLAWILPLYRKSDGRSWEAFGAMGLIGVQMLLGVAFSFLQMPPWTQPLHLLAAMGLFMVNYWVLVQRRV